MTSRYLFNGKEMKEAREASGLTQAVVAGELGITLRQYCRWEAGEVTLKPYQLEALAELYSDA